MTATVCAACGSPNSEFDSRCIACGSPLPSSPGLPTASALPAIPARDRPQATDLPAGTVVSHFRITGLLGRGGMGVVYRAVDLELGRPVALKFLAAHLVADEPRLRREAQVAAALDHPNLGTLYEIGEHQGRSFLALALYEGETLGARLERVGRLAPADAAAIAGQLAAGLAMAHGAGIVHRDLKPANVFLTTRGRVKLLDFGLARLAGGLDLTAAGFAVGTASYMAPERLLGEKSGPPSDVWSWGVLLYEMLAGKTPFAAKGAPDRRGVVQAILGGAPPALAPLCPDAPPALVEMAERCLAKEPARRPAMADLAALLPAGDGSSVSHALGTGAARPSRRRRRLLVGTGVALAGGLAAALLWHRSRPAPLLYVAVARPAIEGVADPDARALLVGSVEAAMLSSLSAVDGVAPFPAARLAPAGGSAAAVARGTAAGEVMTAGAECTASVCQLTLRRLGARDGRVVRQEGLRISLGSSTLNASAVAAAVRRAYSERRLARSLPELRISEAGYGRYLGLLQALETQRRPLDSIAADLAALERQEPEFVDAWLLDARLSSHLFERSSDPAQLARGLAAARRARELAADDPRPLASLFDLTLASGKLDEAAALLADFRRASPSVSEVLLREARLAERRGDAAGALARLTELVAQQPSWQYLLTLANHETKAGRLADARRHLAELLRRYPGNRQGLLQLASLELMQGDAARGVALFSALAQRSPDLESLGNLGTALLLVRRYAEAESALRQALDRAPGDPRATLNLADALLLRGRVGEARDLYRRLAEPGGPTAASAAGASLRAQALAHLGQPGAAVEAMQQALLRSPGDPQLAYEAALVYALVEDRASALVYAEKATAGGVEAGWFRFPWFDALRRDPGFARRIAGSPPSPAP